MIEIQGSPYGKMANILHCNSIVSKFELQLQYYFHFQTNTLGNLFIT